MDTRGDAGALQGSVQRRLSGPDRLLIAFQMSLLARELALAGLRREHPALMESDLPLVLMRTVFGSDVLPHSHD
jgi:hypothetical protein